MSEYSQGPLPRVIQTGGKRSCCFICVQGCQTALSVLAIQSFGGVFNVMGFDGGAAVKSVKERVSLRADT